MCASSSFGWVSYFITCYSAFGSIYPCSWSFPSPGSFRPHPVLPDLPFSDLLVSLSGPRPSPPPLGWVFRLCLHLCVPTLIGSRQLCYCLVTVLSSPCLAIGRRLSFSLILERNRSHSPTATPSRPSFRTTKMQLSRLSLSAFTVSGYPTALGLSFPPHTRHPPCWLFLHIMLAFSGLFALYSRLSNGAVSNFKLQSTLDIIKKQVRIHSLTESPNTFTAVN